MKLEVNILVKEDCPFCNEKLTIFSIRETISICKKCDANFYAVKNDNQSATDIISFSTNKYSIHIYKNNKEQVTKISDVNDDRTIILANEEVQFNNCDSDSINLKIEKILPFY